MSVPDDWRILAPVSRLLARYQRIGLAVKAALAAGLARGLRWP